jgi:hypothetical protein
MPHTHVLLEIPELVDALLREGHEEHVYGNTGNGVILGLLVCELPPSRKLVRFPFALYELGGVR